MYSPCPIQSLASSCPVLGLFSTSVFLYTLLSFHSNYLNLALFSSSAPDSCELHNYYLVLSFLFMCSCIQVAVCLPMFFPNKTNINTHSSIHNARPIARRVYLSRGICWFHKCVGPPLVTLSLLCLVFRTD